jgi:hypothetical protein
LPEGGFRELVNYERPVTEEETLSLAAHGLRRTVWPYCRLDLPLGDSVLRLQFDPDIHEVTLLLIAQGEKLQLGWDDQAHWHPHVLRFEELDLFCRCIARLDPSLPHPGVPLLMFCRFAPVTDSEKSARAITLLHEAWRSLGLFNPEQIGNFMRIVDYRGTGVEWRQDSHARWNLYLDRDLHPEIGLYTLRCGENPDFPHRHLAVALSKAREIAAA